MNHSYKIVTNKVGQAASGQRLFVARLANIYIEIDGERIAAPYPNRAFVGATYATAMLKANDAFKRWLARFKDDQKFVRC